MNTAYFPDASSGSEEESIQPVHRFKNPIERQSLDPTDRLDHNVCIAILEKTGTNSLANPQNKHDSIARFKNPVLVGLGTFGLIYSALDLRAESPTEQSYRRVAIKFLRPSKKHNAVAKKRFHSEATALGSTQHPNIVRLIEFREVNELPLIIIELADHGSLADYMHNNKSPMPPRQAAWLMMKIAEALHDAHSSRLIHRDIKPGNILLRTANPEEKTEGVGLWPLLTDFGLAKDVSPEDPRSKWTQIGEVLGTVRYMSPEQIRGETLKTQTDLFSLGVVLHELLSGENPFIASSDFETQENIVNHPPRPFDRKLRIPRELQVIVQRCLSKEPVGRYPSANAIAIDLNNYLTGKPISQNSFGAWNALVQLVRLTPILSTFIFTLLLSTFVAAILLNWEWRTQRELARQRKEINELFLKSINIVNSAVNDTVIAGARVSHEDWLSSLQKQIPLLEQALKISPEDRKLMLNLQVMQHYAALCYMVLADQPSRSDRSVMQADGIAMRHKSLYLIERLLEYGPINDPVAYQRRLRDRIVGEHWLGLAFNFPGQEEQRIDWFNRSIDHAESYLIDHPSDLPIESLLQSNRMEKAVVLRKENPMEAIEELEKVYRYYSSMEDASGFNIEPATHALKALASMTRIHIESGDTNRINVALNRCTDFVQMNVVKNIPNNWKYRDLLITTHGELCRDLHHNGCWLQLEKIANNWSRSVETLPDWSETGSVSEIERCRDSSLIAAAIFEILGQEQLGQSQEIDTTKLRLNQTWNRYKANPVFDREKFLRTMMNHSVSKEYLTKLLD